MADQEKVQFSFSGGEISPDVLGHSDIDRWQSSAGIVRNWIPRSDGGAMNRPGTEMFGYEHQRYILPHASKSFSLATAGFPTKVLSTAHGLSSGDLISVFASGTDNVFIGVVSEIEVADANNFYVLNLDTTGVSVSSGGSYAGVEPSRRARAISFEFGVSDTYTLYFGDRYLMVSRGGALVLESTTHTATTFTVATGRRSKITLSAGVSWFSGDEVFLGDFTPYNDKDRGNKRYRVHADDTGTPDLVSAITQASPGVVTTSAAHGMLGGDHVYFHTMPGMTELQGGEYEVFYLSPTTFSLLDQWGVAVDTTGFSAYSFPTGFVQELSNTVWSLDGTGGGTVGAHAVSIDVNRYYIMRTPYTEADLPNIKYARSQDATTMTLTCDGFAPRKLTRTAHDNWSLTETNFIPSIEPPLVITASSPGTTHLVKVSAVSKGTGEEGVAREQYVGTAGANTLSWDSVDDAFEYNVYISRLGENTVGFLGITESSSLIIDTSLSGATPDFTIRPPRFENPFFVDGATATISGAVQLNPIVVTTTAAHGVEDGQFVRIEAATGMPELDNKVFRATNVTSTTLDLDLTDGTGHAGAATGGRVIPLTATDHPTAVAYDEQRLILGSTPGHPQAIYMSRSRSYDSMNTSFPLKDSDAIALEVAGEGSNAIRHLVPAGSLLAFTAGGSYEIVGEHEGLLTPASASPIGLAADGCSQVRPLKVGTNVVYVAEQGPNVIELISSSTRTDRGSYTQGEPFLSALARHLFDGFTIEESARARHPDSVLWWTRDDGLLLGLTYVSAAQVVGWSHHDTDGDFESVATSPEPPRTGTYFSVKRTLNNVTKRYFERFNARDFDDVEDAVFLDSSLKFDEAFPATTLRDHWSTLRFYVGSGHTFVAGDQFDVTHKIRVTSGIVDGDLHKERLAVTSTGADYVVCEDLEGNAFDGTTALSGVDTRTLTIHRCTSSVTGADHLAGVTVGLLLDGNPAPAQTVSAAGTLTFTGLHSRIVIGLPIEADIETLEPDAPGGPFQSLQGKKMRAHHAALNVKETRGLQIGADADSLLPIKWAENIGSKYGTAANLITDRVYTTISRKWGKGKVFIRQSDPLPATILSLKTTIEVDG